MFKPKPNTERRLNVHNKLKRRPQHLMRVLYVQFTFCIQGLRHYNATGVFIVNGWSPNQNNWKMENGTEKIEKWNHNNRATNLSVVIMHLKDHSVINVFSSSLRLFDPKRNVSTTVASFWFNKEHYMLLIFSKRVFFWFL